jgi:hypothetical protein
MFYNFGVINLLNDMRKYSGYQFFVNAVRNKIYVGKIDISEIQCLFVQEFQTRSCERNEIACQERSRIHKIIGIWQK